MARSPSSEMFRESCIRARPGKIIIDPTRFVADPDKAAFPELPYRDVRLGYMACGIQRRYRLPSCARAPGLLPRLFLQRPRRARTVPGPDQAGRADGAQLSASCGQVFERYPVHALERFERRMLFERAASASSPRGRARAPRCSSFRRRPKRDCGGPIGSTRGDLAATVADSARPRSAKRVFGAFGRARLPSPSRHIYKSLTIAVAFHGSAAFDRVWQHSIKVDGTFA
jgi:hypothetical protein